jgi:4'-phosphopantetheinyl transferase
MDGCRKDVPVVWQARLTDDPAMETHLASVLSAEERSRLARLRQREDQQRFLIGRGLLRIILGAHLSVPAKCVDLAYGPFGKPFVTTPDRTPRTFGKVAADVRRSAAGDFVGKIRLHTSAATRAAVLAAPQTSAPALQFNVSHSGKLVLLAFHSSREVGVDVEAVRPDQDWEAVALRMLPAGEYRRLASLNPKDRLTAFFQAWTRREAAVKAAGRGFVDESNVVVDAQLETFDLAMPEGYQGAVAFQEPQANFNIQHSAFNA